MGGDDACLKLFRITLLGRAESGKTSLCNMFIANGCNPRYEHTEDPHLYYREVKPKDVADLTRGDGYTGGGSDHTGEAKRARKKKGTMRKFKTRKHKKPGIVCSLLPNSESRAALRRASSGERRGWARAQRNGSGRGAHLHLPKTPPPVRDGHDR